MIGRQGRGVRAARFENEPFLCWRVGLWDGKTLLQVRLYRAFSVLFI